ncbi:hypothetical protein MKK88_10295 [Methylobacterium sp. E-005]|uniref:hypothetical protein n=1 Tax=Methylobacterium sp. E-005 TaxID=2836549 RepID=UPI001FBB5BA8|nr:hypothetical protein [Methylobacterium sp. E-005]MCJ2086380.1 hypothetical protein [Methylobacterium sp. E-005]
MTAAAAPEAVTPAAVLTLLVGIERHGPNAPAAVAFRSALRRKGIEADHAGGLRALDVLMDAAAADDPTQADARTAILRAAWADLLPDLAWKAQP